MNTNEKKRPCHDQGKTETENDEIHSVLLLQCSGKIRTASVPGKPPELPDCLLPLISSSSLNFSAFPAHVPGASANKALLLAHDVTASSLHLPPYSCKVCSFPSSSSSSHILSVNSCDSMLNGNFLPVIYLPYYSSPGAELLLNSTELKILEPLPTAEEIESYIRRSREYARKKTTEKDKKPREKKKTGTGEPVIRLSKGCKAYNLIRILAECGEMSPDAYAILGNEAKYAETATRLSRKQKIRLEDGREYEVKVLNKSGKGDLKSIRLSTKAKPLTDALGYPNAMREAAKRQVDEFHLKRRFKISEAYCQFLISGIIDDAKLISKAEFPVDENPAQPITKPVAKPVEKRGKKKDSNWVHFSITRVIAWYGNHPVYNIKWGEGVWSVDSEIRTRVRTEKVFGSSGASVFISNGYQSAMRVIENGNRMSIYQVFKDGIICCPFGAFGGKLFHLIDVPVNSVILGEPDNKRPFEYYKTENGKYVFSFLDSDVLKLHRLGLAQEYWKGKLIVYCFEEQKPFLAGYLGDESEGVEYRCLDIDEILGTFS